MGEIVQFSRPRDSEPTRTKAELDIERAQHITMAIRSKESLSPFDQVKAAENLWELVQEGKVKYGLRSADLAKEAGLGGKDGAGGKPLDTYCCAAIWMRGERQSG